MRIFKRILGIALILVGVVGFFLPLIPFIVLFPLGLECLGVRTGLLKNKH